MSALMQRIGAVSVVVLLLSGMRPPGAGHTLQTANAVWVPGFWDLRGNPLNAPRGGWVYVPGQWVTAPVSGARWVPGDWSWRNDWWSWTPGHWEVSPAKG
jgi:hypothetical protein